MRYREIDLRSTAPEAVGTEIMYEVAACRADGVDLVRLNIREDEDSTDAKRLFSAVIRLLRNMKQKGAVQFFATRVDFLSSSTEAVFLQNKYPEIFSPMPSENDGSLYIYIKV